jgi:aspartate/methionine/tyrosine aminotransferase
MRNNLIHPGADELTYAIREIIQVGHELEKLGVQMTWENIGDPIAKGQKVPDWIKELIKEEVNDNKSFGYSPTKGVLETRKFIADQRNDEKLALRSPALPAGRLSEEGGEPKLDPEDILFFNGLGDAISKTYTYLNKDARVIGPSPAYPTHSSAEAAHADSHHIMYNLLPEKNWQPDMEDLRNKVKYDPYISGILIINPGNPTGALYPKSVLQEMVNLAKEFDLFLICDEIYANIAYGENEKFTPLHKLIDGVPTIIMRGLSKEIPWPGSRCGWIEVYNKDKDTNFARYVKTLVDAKMLEVCSTTLPQQVLPKIYSDERYEKHLKENAEKYAKKSKIAYEIFKNTPKIISPKTDGAFYVAVVFNDGAINGNQKLKIENKEARELIEKISADVSPDKKFVYYLMAATGICVVPLSGFSSKLNGFRMTLLEPDEEKFKRTVETISEKIKEYVGA